MVQHAARAIAFLIYTYYLSLLPLQQLHYLCGSTDKTTEFTLSSGTLMHVLLRIMLPFFFMCYIIISAHLLTSGSFSAWQLSYFLLPETIWASDYCMPPSQFHMILNILQWLLMYSLLARTVNFSSPVKSQSKTHTWQSTYSWRAIYNWVAGVSGKNTANGAGAAHMDLWEITKIRKGI